MDDIKSNKENKDKIEEINEFYNGNLDKTYKEKYSEKIYNEIDDSSVFKDDLFDEILNRGILSLIILVTSLILLIFVIINIF